MWTDENKGTVISEYPYSVEKYFKSQNIDEKKYSLIRVSGSTESYLASRKSKVHYCDAIVESGKTVKDNDLLILSVLT